MDGATNERPIHAEAPFMSTERHLKHGNLCTLRVMPSFVGGSYLNKVELQNGFLALELIHPFNDSLIEL